MLGSLARKTRALGFKTIYYPDEGDKGILQIARSKGCVILTSNKGLYDSARHSEVGVLFVSGETDRRRLVSLLDSAKSSGINLVKGEPSCTLCGGDLQIMSRSDVAGRVPLSVEKRHRLFFRCMVCGKYYWKGSHWKKLRLLNRILSEIPFATVLR